MNCTTKHNDYLKGKKPMLDFEMFYGATWQTKTNFNSPDQVTATTLYAHTFGVIRAVSELSVETLKE